VFSNTNVLTEDNMFKKLITEGTLSSAYYAVALTRIGYTAVDEQVNCKPYNDVFLPITSTKV
jgi:hypothetical protein